MASDYRLKGNELYQSASKESLAPVIREKRLQDALKYYNMAIQSCAKNDGHELSSAYKNSMVVSFDLFKHSSEKNDNMSIHEEKYLIKQMLDHGAKAFDAGRIVKSYEWLENVKEKMRTAINYLDEYLTRNFGFHRKLNLLNHVKEIASSINTLSFLLSLIIQKLHRMYFNESVKQMENDDLVLSSQYINECPYYLNEMRRLKLLDKDSISELNVDVAIQMNIVDALLSKRNADKLYHRFLNEDETLDIEKVWDSIDSYRIVILKAKDCDLELEAEILSIIGNIYDNVLKMRDKSKTYYYACFNMCEAQKPRTFNNKSWYIRCTKAIKKLQDEVVKNENDRKEEEKKKVLTKIEPDLNKIIEAGRSKTQFNFLCFVYEKYPCKINSFQFDSKVELEGKQLKQAYQKAMTHYHPDKNSPTEYGYEWYFVAEQICKELGGHYECMK